MALINDAAKGNKPVNAAAAPAPAPVAAPAAPVAGVNAPNTVSSSMNAKAEQFEAQREKAYANRSEEEKALSNSASDTLKFLHSLGLQSKRAKRRGANGEDFDSFRTYGGVFVSTKDITVPQIDGRKYTYKTQIPPEAIVQKPVKAGEPFQVTMLEAMYLLARPEYDLSCMSPNGASLGFTVQPKFQKVFSLEQALPTPTFKYTQGGSPKADQKPMDVNKGTETAPKWEIQPEYAEKFGHLLEKSTVTRVGASPAAQGVNSAKTAAAIRSLFGVKA